MQILLNSNNEITSYAIVGGFENGVEVETIPENFEITFKPLRYKYENNQIFLNESYSEEVDIPDKPIIVDNSIGTDEELRKMFASMQVQLVQANTMVMQLSQQNARLSQEMVIINQKLEEVTNDENVIPEV